MLAFALIPLALSGAAPALPSGEDLWSLLTLQDYNTRVVLLGVTLLGAASGLIGSFMLLRKRSLLGDALSHATLPGIGVAFLVMTAAGYNGKWLPGLLAGAFASGVVGMLAIVLLLRFTRIKEDAALGVVLSVFFGLGVAILSIIQSAASGNAAGLESFIYGKTASLLAQDMYFIGGVALLIMLSCVALLKEFTLLSFDSAFAGAQGWPVHWLDVYMLGLVALVTVIGLQAVGLVLMIALLVIPAAAARFWTEDLKRMSVLAAGIGAVSGLVGGGLSGLVAKLPAGAIIVLVAGVAFLFSLTFGTARGILRRLWEQHTTRRRVERQNLLRAFYEYAETHHEEGARPYLSFGQLLMLRGWTAGGLRSALRSALRAGIATKQPDIAAWRLTEDGFAAARRVVRNHRLWELYLINHAETAPGQVDREADRVEHVLDQALLFRLEQLLATEHPELAWLDSPHPLLAEGSA